MAIQRAVKRTTTLFFPGKETIWQHKECRKKNITTPTTHTNKEWPNKRPIKSAEVS